MKYMRTTLLLLGVLAFELVPIAIPSTTYQMTLVLGFMLAALGVSVAMRAGLVSFGQALFFAIGGYGAAYIADSQVLGAMPTVILAGVIAAGVAIPVGLFVTRYRGIFYAMLNLALSMVLYTLLLKSYAFTGGSDGLNVTQAFLVRLNLSVQEMQVGFFFFVSLITLVFALLLRKYWLAPPGRSLVAIHDNELRVGYMGANVTAALMAAYVFGAFLTGVGGAVTAIATAHVDPGSAYWVMSAGILIAAVLGGTGNVFGPMVGAVLFELISIYASQFLSSTWELLLGFVVFFVVRLMPTGIWGIYDKLWHHPSPVSRTSYVSPRR